jgi:hypothetical protein
MLNAKFSEQEMREAVFISYAKWGYVLDGFSFLLFLSALLGAYQT